MKQPRPIEPLDVVRIKKGLPGKTGVVNRVDGESVNVFIKNEYIGIWFNVREVKRIGKTRGAK